MLPEEMSCAGWFLVLGAAWALGGSWGQGEGRAAAANPRDAAAIQPRMQGAAPSPGQAECQTCVAGWTLECKVFPLPASLPAQHQGTKAPSRVSAVPR